MSFYFFKEGIKNISEVGAIFISSKFLLKKMLKPIDFSGKKVIVEFGAGSGNMTRMLLDKMDDDSILYSFEINPVFISKLEKIDDPRLILINDSVEQVSNYVKMQEADCVISGLPLANFSKESKKNILKEVGKILKPGQLFVQFQYSLTDKKLLEQFFKTIGLQFTLINIPPAFVYFCRDHFYSVD